MQNIIQIVTPVGRAVFDCGDSGVSYAMDAASPGSFVFRCANGMILWRECLPGAILIDGACEARSVLGKDGAPALSIARVVDGSLRIEFLVPAVDVMAVAPMCEGAMALREALIEFNQRVVFH